MSNQEKPVVRGMTVIKGVHVAFSEVPKTSPLLGGEKAARVAGELIMATDLPRARETSADADLPSEYEVLCEFVERERAPVDIYAYELPTSLTKGEVVLNAIKQRKEDGTFANPDQLNLFQKAV